MVKKERTHSSLAMNALFHTFMPLLNCIIQSCIASLLSPHSFGSKKYFCIILTFDHVFVYIWSCCISDGPLSDPTLMRPNVPSQIMNRMQTPSGNIHFSKCISCVTGVNELCCTIEMIANLFSKLSASHQQYA